jgi:5-methylcytosine-specific restriction endonuclease McrA
MSSTPQCHPDRKHVAFGLCKACYAKKRYAEDIYTSRAKSRRYSQKRWSEKRETILEEARSRRAQNPEKFRNATRKWRKANPGKSCEASRRWRKQNADKSREMLKAWHEKNPDARKRYEGARRARKKGCEASLTNAEWLSRLSEFQDRCAYCGSLEKLTIDHIVPLSRGGAHTSTNVAPACLSCNTSKHTKLLAEWIF